jgi:hypothetical protein
VEETVPVDGSFLGSTLDVVNKAVAMADSPLYDEGEKALRLAEAGRQACAALRQLDHQFWASLNTPEHLVDTAVQIVTDRRHFADFLLPVSADLLGRLGYVPPPSASEFVGRARDAFESAQQRSPRELHERIASARMRVEALRDETCRLSDLAVSSVLMRREQAKRGQQHGSWLRRVRGVVPAVLLALVPTAVSSEIDHAVDLSHPPAIVREMSEAGKAAIHLLARHEIARAANGEQSYEP